MPAACARLRSAESFSVKIYKNTAYCVGGSGTLFKSTDKGQTWAKERTEGKVGANLYDVKFSPDGTAYVLGNAAVLLRSTGN